MAVRYEYGSAIRDLDGTVWDEMFYTDEPPTESDLAAWNREHAIANPSGSVVVVVRRAIPEIEVVEPAPDLEAD